jgi:hypothetical protein
MLPFQAMVDTDTEGNFEIKGLLLGRQYRLIATAKGYRKNEIEVSSGNVPNVSIDIGKILLDRGRFSVSGVVVDKKRKPVANASVYCLGRNQADIHTKTDAKGRFKAYGIFEGQVVVTAHKKEESTGDLWYGQKHSRAGATNVMVVLRQKTNYGRK